SYTTAGEGLPVILLHGFGEDSSIFDKQISLLKNHCYVIVPDLPGSGYSDFNASLKTIEDYAAMVNALLQFEHIEACKMFG
ncbi:alpha/beta hydrolase, partial [Acinetobacter baumannii]